MFESSFSKNSRKIEARRQKARSAIASYDSTQRKPKIDPVLRAKANKFLKNQAANLGHPNCGVWDAIFLMERYYRIKLPELERGDARSTTAIAMAEAVRKTIARIKTPG